VFGFMDATRVDPDSSSSQSPVTSWRSNWNHMFVMTLAVEVAFWPVIGLTGGPAGGLLTSEAWLAFLASVH